VSAGLDGEDNFDSQLDELELVEIDVEKNEHYDDDRDTLAEGLRHFNKGSHQA